MSEAALEHASSLSPAARAKVGEWLSGIHAIQEGVLDVFFIERSDDVIVVKPSNAGEIEFKIYDAFESHIVRGEN